MAPGNVLNSLFQVCSRGSCVTLLFYFSFSALLHSRPLCFHILSQILPPLEHLLFNSPAAPPQPPSTQPCSLGSSPVFQGKILLLAPLFASITSAASSLSSSSSHPAPVTLQSIWNWNIWYFIDIILRWGVLHSSGHLQSDEGSVTKQVCSQSCPSLLLLPVQLLALKLSGLEVNKLKNKKEKGTGRGD